MIMENFILIAVTLFLLCIIGYMLINNNKSKYKQQEQRLFKLYQNIEEMMEDFEEYITEVKGQIDKEKNKLINLYEKLDKGNMKNEKLLANDFDDKKLDIENFINSENKSKNPVQQYSNNKISNVISLHNKGLSKEQIAKELKMSRGEVQLILNI